MRSERVLQGLGLFLLLTALASGHTSSGDEETIYRTAQGFWNGRLDLDRPIDRAINITAGRGGLWYPYYPPGGALLIAPWIGLGNLLDGLLRLGPYGLRAFSLAFPAILVAWFVSDWRARTGTGRAESLLFVFGTLLGTWSRTLQPLVPLSLLLCAAWLRRDAGTPARLGAMLGAATLLRYDAGIWFLGLLARGVRRPADLARVAAGFAPFLLGIAAYNAARFGSPWTLGVPDTRGGVASVLSGSIGEGLYGFLLSPSRSILLYAPLSLVAGAALWRNRPADRGLLAATVLPALAWYSANPVWHGGPGWGPRYLLPGLTLLALGLAETPAQWRIGVRAASTAGVLLYALSVLTPVDAHFDRVFEAGASVREAYTDWKHFPVAGQIRALASLRWEKPDLPSGWIPGGAGHPWAEDLRRTVDLWPVYVWKTGRSPAFLLFWAATLGSGILLLVRADYAPRDDAPRRDPGGDPVRGEGSPAPGGDGDDTEGAGSDRG